MGLEFLVQGRLILMGTTDGKLPEIMKWYGLSKLTLSMFLYDWIKQIENLIGAAQSPVAYKAEKPKQTNKQNYQGY